MNAAIANNANLVESNLVAASHDISGTLPWHTGIALDLMLLVHEVQRQGHSAILSDLVTRAESHLKQADLLARTAAQHADAQALLGLLNERYIGNMQAAIAYYQSAASLDPAHKLAKQAGDRLQRSEQRLQQRVAERRAAK